MREILGWVHGDGCHVYVTKGGVAPMLVLTKPTRPLLPLQ